MPSTTALISIGILIGSFIIGIIFFYVINKGNRKEKKQRMDTLLSFVVNFVLFIWAGKIMLHLSLFFQDPFAVLAYPSDSKAFYIATILIIINLLYHYYRKNLQVYMLLETAIPVFIATTFTYEFLQIVIVESQLAWPNVILSASLLLIYLFMYDKQSTEKIALFVFTIWTLAHVTFYFVFSFTKLLGYYIHPIYFVSIYVLAVGLFLYCRGRKVIGHGN